MARAVDDGLGSTVGLILEGVSGSGKTTILEALLRSERYLGRGHLSSLVLTEHQTQRVLEPKQRTKGLSVEDNVALLRRHVGTISALEAGLRGTGWSDRNRVRHRVCYVLERFHLTHVCHYPHVGWDDVEDLDRTLARLGCKLCLLTADRSVLEGRVTDGRDDLEWRTHLSSLGAEGEAARYRPRPASGPWRTNRLLSRDLRPEMLRTHVTASGDRVSPTSGNAASDAPSGRRSEVEIHEPG